MKLWKRIKIYKNLLLAVWTLNLVLIFTGLIFVYAYFSNHYNFEESFKLQLAKVSEIDRLLLELEQFDPNTAWTGQKWVALGTIKARTENLNVSKNSGIDSLFLSQTPPDLSALKAALIEEKTEVFNRLSKSSEKLGHYRIEILIVGIASVIFGIVIPLILILKLRAKTKAFQQRIENQVVEGLKIWRQQSQKHSGGVGASSVFWTEFALLTFGQVCKEIDHPLAFYATQLANRIIQEMQSEESQIDLEKSDQVS